MIALACPFCGCTSGYFDSTDDKPAWTCSCCGARGPSDYESPAPFAQDMDAVNAWNRRSDGTHKLTRDLDHERDRYARLQSRLEAAERRERDVTRDRDRLQSEIDQLKRKAA